MKVKNKTAEYRLSIMRKEEELHDYHEDPPDKHYMRPQRWNEWVGFELTDEEVIEILALITRMRGVVR